MNEMYYNNQQPFNNVYAYARVSSSDQNEARQIAAFEQLPINRTIRDSKRTYLFGQNEWEKF